MAVAGWLCQRELGQFFGRVARWAARLYKSDGAINMFDPDSSSEFDTAQKFFEFFNEHRDAKRECSNGRLGARPLSRSSVAANRRQCDDD